MLYGRFIYLNFKLLSSSVFASEKWPDVTLQEVASYFGKIATTWTASVRRSGAIHVAEFSSLIFKILRDIIFR